MNKMLFNEWLKIKHSRLLYFSLVCIVFSPLALLLLMTILNSDPKYDPVTYLEYMSMILKFITSVVGLTLYNWMAAEMVSREFRLDTIKSQLTIPIARTDFLFLKLTTISIGMLFVTALSFILGVLISFGLDLVGLNFAITIKLFVVYLKSSFLMLPFTYFTVLLVLIFKQSFLPMIINVLILILTFAMGKFQIFAVFPWTAPTRIIFLASGQESSFSIGHSYYSIIALGLISMFLAYRQINRMEI
ncbi:MAG: ABC transporter permease [Clostridiales bacterium]|nr:ABC transporter permease [Clostridiales bacterium]